MITSLFQNSIKIIPLLKIIRITTTLVLIHTKDLLTILLSPSDLSHNLLNSLHPKEKLFLNQPLLEVEHLPSLNSIVFCLIIDNCLINDN